MDFPPFVIHSRLPRRCANEDENERRSRSPGQTSQDRGAVRAAGTAGEKAAAGAAADRIRARVRQEEKQEKPVQMRFSLPDPWARRTFIALCRCYGLRPYRYPRTRKQSGIVPAPEMFLYCSFARVPGDQHRAHRVSGPGDRQGDPPMSRWLIIFGVVLIAAGLLWPLLQKLGLGRLPGDIIIERGNLRFYFPIVTSLIISVVLSLILWLLNR
jgi:DUF2905 family protein